MPKIRLTPVLAAFAMVFTLTACDKQEQAAAEQKIDNAAATAESRAREAAADARAAANQAGAEVKAGAQEIKKDASEAAGNVAAAASDATITAAVNAKLAADPDLSAIRINVDTANGHVTLNGPAPTQAAKDKATSIARAVEGVSGVTNNLEIKS